MRHNRNTRPQTKGARRKRASLARPEQGHPEYKEDKSLPFKGYAHGKRGVV